MATMKRCCCDGPWQRRKDCWVVTQRGFAVVDGVRKNSLYCQLKCRRCLCKWRVKAAYTEKLPDYQERGYKRLSYATILQLILENRLTADFVRGRIYKQRRYRNVWRNSRTELVVRRQRNQGTSGNLEPVHCYVQIYYDNCRREISLARLLWMIYHRQELLPDFDIDHIDGDPENNNITNLAAVPSTVNRSRAEHATSWDQVPF